MDYDLYFSPVDHNPDDYSSSEIGSDIVAYREKGRIPEIKEGDFVLAGIADDRGDHRPGSGAAPKAIRPYFYRLCKGNNNIRIVDIGDIEPGETVEDTYFAIGLSLSAIVKAKAFPIFFGGGHNMGYAQYKAYGELEQIVNMCVVDSRIDLGQSEGILDADSVLSHIILNQPNFLFNLAVLAYQRYYVNKDALELMSRLYFDAYRLGEIQDDLRDSEPIVRDADFVSFDMGAIRWSDAPAASNPTPNGLYGEEACAIARYSGMSDKLSSFGLFGLNPDNGNHGQTEQLAAQIIWHVMEGYCSRKHDYPSLTKKDFVKYRVTVQEGKNEILFYKSKKSDRWWLDVPYPLHKGVQYERHHLVPCSYRDYERALEDDLPDRWWRVFQKLS